MWCALLLTFTTALGARAADVPYYLALGDSLALGIQPAADGSYTPTNQGYVDDLYAFYRARLPQLQLQKLGCSGETLKSIMSGPDSPCAYPAGSQLAQAIAFIQTHHVVLITIDIGGDDLLACGNLKQTSTPSIDPTCVASALSNIPSYLPTIIGALRAYAPQARIVGMNYYDPLLAAVVFGGVGQSLATQSLYITNLFNTTLATFYGALQVPMADVAGTFRINSFPANVLLELAWTWMSAPAPRGPDVHPNALGYLAIASAFAHAIQ
jgi:lysophospholipase L1-like esterase